MKRVVIFIALLLILPSVFATNYYINATTGSDGNSGTSPATAWKTISKVNSMTFSPGDNIYFERGQMWREQLNTPSSGSAGNPITFGAYGSGNKPIISGANLISGWSAYGTNVWKATATNEPNQVFFNGVKGTLDTLSNLDASLEWNWTNQILYVYSTSDPDTAYINPGIEAAVRDRAININKDYISIENFTLKDSRHDTISTSKNATEIRDCTVLNAGKIGITFWGPNTSITYGLVKSCNVSHSKATGVFVGYSSVPGPSGVIIEDSDMGYNGELDPFDHGIYLSRATNCIVRYNILHHNIAHGIQFQAGSDKNKMYYNIVHSNNNQGVWIGTGNGGRYNEIYNNLFYNNKKYGVLLGTNPIDNNTQNIIKNNIFYQDGSVTSIWAAPLRLHTIELVAGNTFDNNIYYFPNGNDPDKPIEIGMGSTTWYTLSGWQALSGSPDPNSMNVDPLFTNAAGEDFSLQTLSSAIDGGTDVGLIRDFLGVSVPQGAAPDIGVFEYLKVLYSNFNGSTTNLDTIDLSNIQNLLLENTLYGRINFTELVTLNPGTDLNTHVIFSKNSVSVNSIALPELNKSAIVTIYNVNFTNPQILRDGVVCPTSICTEIEYSGGNFKFSVTHFSTYSIQETPTGTETTGGTSGGGGGGGAGSGTSSTPSVTETQTVEQATPSGSIIFNGFDPELRVKQVEIKVKNEVQNVGLVISKYDSRPELIPLEKKGLVYRYLQLQTVNLGDSLDKVIVTFFVDRDWVDGNELTPSEVSFFRYEEEPAENWKELKTSYNDSDDDYYYYYYEAESDDFGYFAIGEQSKSLFDNIRVGTPAFFLLLGIILVMAIVVLVIIKIIFKTRNQAYDSGTYPSAKK